MIKKREKIVFLSLFISKDNFPCFLNYESYYSHENLDKEKVGEAVKNLKEALSRLKKNSNFVKLYGSITIGEFLPLMIKESFLDNSKKSDTGAKGYFQLKSPAIKDARGELKKMGINEKYNPNIPVESCILGIMYFVHIKNLTKDKLKGYKYSQEFELLSYNGGADRVGSIIKTYKTENKNIGNNLVWENFVKWLVSRLEKNPLSKQTFSKEYNVYYKDWFKKPWTKDNSVIRFSGLETKKSKIYEMINYVEKINAIKSTNQEKINKVKLIESGKNVKKSQEKGKIIIKTQSKIERLNAIIEYNKSKDKFHGDGPIDNSWYNLKKFFGYNKRYKQIQSISGDGVISMLNRSGISPKKENLKKFYDINNLENDDKIVQKVFYLLPNIRDQQIQEREIPNEKRPDFYKWLNGIEIKNNKLKGKLFILDPGHGGADPGAIPIAKDENGKSILYKQSDIDSKDRVVNNGKGDGFLHVVEAKVTMDVSYRLAKLIRENGGEVKITHYFQNGIDESVWTESSREDAPGLLDQIEKFDTWSDRNKFNVFSRAGLHKRAEIRNQLKKGKNEKNAYFISIHADRNGEKTNNAGMNILYAKNFLLQKEFANKLAENIGKVRRKKTTFGIRNTPLHVLNPDFGAHNQNVLIELGNMNNENTSYALRNGKVRQEYAEGIFNGLLKTASK